MTEGHWQLEGSAAELYQRYLARAGQRNTDQEVGEQG